jgi:hypothetical protein
VTVEPRTEHHWLQKLVGEWTYESGCDMGPDQPSTFAGRETVRSVGGLWVVCESQVEVPGGGTGTNVMTLGYDPAKGRFVGTFISSMMTHLWVYDGELDAAGKVLTLDAEGPSFTPDGTPGGGTAKYKDAIELVSDDHRVLTSRMLTPDGAWVQFMTATYRRVK